MENTVVICTNTSEFETLNKHYNKDYDTPSPSSNWPYGFRVTSKDDVGYSRLEYYQEHHQYSVFKYVSFVEWSQLTNPKPTTKSESNMKYVVEVNSTEEAEAVYKLVDPKNTQYHTKVKQGEPRVITSTGKNGSLVYAQDADHLATYGPILKFKDWALMFGVELKPNKKLVLTTDYTAEVNYNTKIVQVGCQSIPFSKVTELHNLIMQ